MSRASWRERIAASPDIHHGDPCIKGTRVAVATIVGCLADGMTADEILKEYPQLSEGDITAALAYAAEVLHQEILLPLAR
jgi:uncharacterized protein (DUF433 family)